MSAMSKQQTPAIIEDATGTVNVWQMLAVLLSIVDVVVVMLPCSFG